MTAYPSARDFIRSAEVTDAFLRSVQAMADHTGTTWAIWRDSDLTWLALELIDLRTPAGTAIHIEPRNEWHRGAA